LTGEGLSKVGMVILFQGSLNPICLDEIDRRGTIQSWNGDSLLKIPKSNLFE